MTIQSLTAAQRYIIEHWSDWRDLQQTYEGLERHVKEQLTEAGNRFVALLGDTGLRAETDVYGGNRFLYLRILRGNGKKSWQVGKTKWSFVGILVDGVDVKSLMGDGEFDPYLCVFNGLDGNRCSIFNKHIRDRMDRVSAGRRPRVVLESWKDLDQLPAGYDFPLTPHQWVRKLCSGAFQSEILNALTAVKFVIPEIDRALAAARTRLK